MKPVTDLYGRYTNQEIYILGTGPSARAFPIEILQDKTVIGLNMAWKLAPIQYGITIHPDLNIPEFMEGEDARPDITWITKRNKSRGLLTAEQFLYADANFYHFDDRPKEYNTSLPGEPANHSRVVDWVLRPTDNHLYCWSSIAQTGMNLAANMGAKTIYLIGCDNCDIGNNHHAHAQHTRWKGADPNVRYRQYYEGTRDVRDALMQRGVNVVSLTAFLGAKNVDEEFEHLCRLKNKPLHIISFDKIAN